MSDLDRNTVREQLKTISEDEFIRANTKVVLEEKAAILGADVTNASTKKDIYDAMVAAANLPDPSLRGKSLNETPVAAVWDIADLMIAQPRAKGIAPARRKDVIEAAQNMGVAFYTARTQYQTWFTVSGRGTRTLAEIPDSELPQALQRGDTGGDTTPAEGGTDDDRRKSEGRRVTARRKS